jgi:uncharacterized protein (DUF2249 family)
MTVIDVRTIPPRDRHPLIFQHLDELASGNSVRLVNDHDPVPLRHHLDEPLPLEGVLAGQGFGHDAHRLDDGDWRVTFRQPDSTPPR